MRHRALDEILGSDVVRAGVAHAATAGLAFRGQGGWNVYTGAAGHLSADRRAEVDTVFDLASVSKPFLAVLCARLAEQGRLSWETQLGALLPEARGTPTETASVEHLLSHRAGLQPHIELFAPLREARPLRRSAALRRAALGLRQECEGKRAPYPAVYSDLGYLLVGAALHRHMALPLDDLLAFELFRSPRLEIGSAKQWMRRGHFAARVAPTEVVPWRGGRLVGTVHDDNSWALAGYGAAGHAGLFSGAEALLDFATALLDALDGREATVLTRASMLRLLARRDDASLRCGFDGKAAIGAAAGAAAGPNTFGHLGFTGTSFWCDPDAGVVTVLLTNRVHPTRQNQRIRAARPKVHERLFQLGGLGKLS